MKIKVTVKIVHLDIITVFYFFQFRCTIVSVIHFLTVSDVLIGKVRLDFDKFLLVTFLLWKTLSVNPFRIEQQKTLCPDRNLMNSNSII